eukprot:8498811-Karenia_brevis.AAC.1
MRTAGSQEEFYDIFKWREKWRFHQFEPDEPNPALSSEFIEWAGGLSPLGGSSEQLEPGTDFPVFGAASCSYKETKIGSESTATDSFVQSLSKQRPQMETGVPTSAHT